MMDDATKIKILATRRLDDLCLIIHCADPLYPEIPMAQDRICQLREDGGEIISRIEAAARKAADRGRDRLDALRGKSQGSAV